MLHGLWHSLLNKKNTGVQEFRSSGVQEFRSSGVQEFTSSRVHEFTSSRVQEFRRILNPRQTGVQATDREQGLQSLTEIISVAQERGGVIIPISRAF
jgi:hypothetical protein